jgi:hypothetical protein
VDVYVYRADLYCVVCGESIRAALTRAGKAPREPENEPTYDSDYFPKGPYEDAGGDADTVHHCGWGARCLDPTVIAGETHGRFLENPLTWDGVRYLRGRYAEDPENPVVAFWVAWYQEQGYPITRVPREE